jgi:phosphatidylserine/phosphatidylglycerophosphate/cardiolipin synthase-like enzyme
LLVESVANVEATHLPGVHAKVYLADEDAAIVTSANLTIGGLRRNFEYGVAFADAASVNRIREDIVAYARLGALIPASRLGIYGEIADRLRATYQRQISGASSAI